MNSKPMREHSNTQVLVNNIPYIGMIVMGAVILVLGLHESRWTWIAERKPGNRFNEKFKRHIPVIVPLWLIPVLAGVPLIIRTFSWPLLVLLVVFSIDAFVILPLFSRQHGCKECPQKDSCPWMGRKSKPAST
jgi:hypothetical protein